MPGMNAGVDLSQAIGDIEDFEADLDIFRGRLQQVVDEAVRETAEDFRDEVQNQLKQSDIDSDTGELMNSWRVRPKGLAQYEVRSTADHAVFLELGTQPHTITGNNWLKFIPDDPSGYPERNFTEEGGEVKGDFAEDGLVVSPLDPLSDADPETYFAKSVQHPGNEAYGYFQDAVDKKSWKSSLNGRIRQKVSKLIEEFEASG